MHVASDNDGQSAIGQLNFPAMRIFDLADMTTSGSLASKSKPGVDVFLLLSFQLLH